MTLLVHGRVLPLNGENQTLPKLPVSISLFNIQDFFILTFVFNLAASLPVRKMTSAEDEQEFRNKVEKMRRLGGDAWLGLFNEIQNERKV